MSAVSPTDLAEHAFLRGFATVTSLSSASVASWSRLSPASASLTKAVARTGSG